MALHLLKLIWNRKRTNFLIITEILLSFIVVAAVVTMATYYYRNYQKPLGYSYDRIWDVHVRVPRGLDSTPEIDRERIARLVRLLEITRQMPEVEAVDHLQMGLYRNWQWSSDMTVGGRRVEFNGNRAGDDLATTLSVRIVDGRWFSREDAGQNWDAVVLNASFAHELFGDKSAVGSLMPRDESPPQNRPPDQPEDRPQRVVGVVEDFRQFGEFSAPGNYFIMRNDLLTAANATIAPGQKGQPAAGRPEQPRAELPGIIVVRVAPGVTAEFEERLVRALQVAAPDWSFAMQPLENIRANYNRTQYLTPLAVMGLLAGFLLVMVALGLSGVLWQNVTQRIRELGLRRAKGADRRNIRRQILAEQALMTAIAIALGLMLLVQVPMLGWLGPVSTSVFVVSLVLSALAVFLLTAFCSWYPSLLATRIPPAEALRYE